MMDSRILYKKKKTTEADQKELTAVLKNLEEEMSGAPRAEVKAFIRTDVVNANKSVGDGSSSVYQPQLSAVQLGIKSASGKALSEAAFEDAKRLAQERAKKMIQEAAAAKAGKSASSSVASSSIPQNRPPALGKSSTPANRPPALGKPPVSRPPRPGTGTDTARSKTSNLEAFKQELKTIQAERDKRRDLRQHLKATGVDAEAVDRLAPSLDNPYMAGGGEYDDDAVTTNLYISKMPIDVEEQELFEMFGSFGPLASLKILYPRPDEKRRDTLSGFVAFMTRKDTDRALASLQGADLRGEQIRLSFAKPVHIPAIPVYVHPELARLGAPDPPTGLPYNAKPNSKELKAFLDKYDKLPVLDKPVPEEMYEDFVKMMRNAVVRVVIPTDSAILGLVHRTIEFVVREGPLFEALLMQREQNNPIFRFLFDHHQAVHVYYRWKLFSILQGDTPVKWRLEKYRIFDEGPWFEPPPLNLFAGGMPPSLYYLACTNYKKPDERKEEGGRRNGREARGGPRKSEEERSRGMLRGKERRELEEILRKLTPEKNQVADAMCWCVEHAGAAREVSDCICESLEIDETPLHKKIARLYLVSDILANCAARGVRDVFYFRQFLGEKLPKVFAALRRAHSRIEARLKAEQFKQRVMNCFRVWEHNAIYPTEALIKHQNIFLGLMELEDEKGTDEEDEDIDGADIDGIPVEESIDGVPLEKAQEVFEDEDDVDGVPIDEGGGGGDEEPAKASASTSSAGGGFKPAAFKPAMDSDEEDGGGRSPTKEKSATSFRLTAKSKWETEVVRSPTPSTDGEIDEPPARRTGMMTSSTTSTGAAEGDERRRALREIEVKVMKLQDELEADNADDVKEQVESYRDNLMRKLDEKFGGSESSSKKDKKEKDKKEKREKRKRSRSRSRERRSRSRSRDRKRERSRERRKRSRSRSRDRDDGGHRRHRSRSAERARR